MRKQILPFVFLLALLLPLAAAPAFAATDAETEQEITAALVEKLGPDADTIRVAFFDGKCVLSGRVAEKPTKELAKEVALYVPGVKKVENEIEATNVAGLGRGKVGAESQDATLETTVKKALRDEIGDHAGKLEVEACEGVVSLRGMVADQARHDLAMAAATKVQGVVKLIDLLRVAG